MTRAILLPLCSILLLAGRALAAEAPDEPVLERCLVSLIDEAKVPAREAGVLVALDVREGDTVAKGAVIARIDDNQPQFEKRKARAECDQAKAKAENDVDVRYSEAAEKVAEAEFAKAEQSHRAVPNSVTQVERDRLKLNVVKSALQIEQARLEQVLSGLSANAKEVEVEAADNAIERRRITSPIDGIVVEVFPHLGEWMQPGDPLARVVRTDVLRVEGYVDSAKWDPESIRDRPVTVRVMLADRREETFDGRIVFTSPIVESGGDYRVWAEVPNRRETGEGAWILRPGQSATMRIHSKQQPLPARSAALSPGPVTAERTAGEPR
jgi:multidrug efflux pump subunit AcrA (membrane-fusion protein)